MDSKGTTTIDDILKKKAYFKYRTPRTKLSILCELSLIIITETDPDEYEINFLLDDLHWRMTQKEKTDAKEKCDYSRFSLSK